MTHIKTGAKILVILALGGLIAYTYISIANFKKAVQNDLVILSQQTALLGSFVRESFPEQVKTYDANHAPATAPAPAQ